MFVEFCFFGSCIPHDMLPCTYFKDSASRTVLQEADDEQDATRQKQRQQHSGAICAEKTSYSSQLQSRRDPCDGNKGVKLLSHPACH